MNKLDQRLQTTFGRVDQFGIAHGADFTAGGPAAGKGEAKAGTASRAGVRVALHNELVSISNTARAIALSTPGFDQEFRLPQSGSDQALLASATAFVTAATPVAATFIAHEMPADFLTVTQGLIDQFKGTGVAQTTGKAQQVGGTAELQDDRHKGQLMLELLKGVVPNKYANNPTILAEWLTASHVERPSHHKKTTPAAKPAA